MTYLLILIIIGLLVVTVRQHNQLKYLYSAIQQHTEELKALADRGDIH